MITKQNTTVTYHVDPSEREHYDPVLYESIARSALGKMRGWARTRSGKLKRYPLPALHWVLRLNMDEANTATLLLTCHEKQARSWAGDPPQTEGAHANPS